MCCCVDLKIFCIYNVDRAMRPKRGRRIYVIIELFFSIMLTYAILHQLQSSGGWTLDSINNWKTRNESICIYT